MLGSLWVPRGKKTPFNNRLIRMERTSWFERLHRIAVGPQAGRKVFTLQTLPGCGADEFADTVGKVCGFSLHAGVAARADERKKLERLCRYISRPAVAESGYRLRQSATSATS